MHLVTGGTRGIGRSIVEHLVAEGQRVVLTYVSREEAANEIVDNSDGLATALQLDVRDAGACDELIDHVESELGPITGVVNNAGILKQSLLALTSDADWEAVVGVNLGGVFQVCRAVLPQMVRRRGGSIVNMASLSAIRSLPGQSAYAASKAGVVALTRVLAREVGSRGIRVNAVLPGFVETELSSDLRDRALEALRSTEALPAGVTRQDVARTVVFLLSDEAAGITGQAIPVDAGASA